MILQALYQFYQRLLDEPGSGISPPGYSTARVSFALNLSEAGELLDLIDLRDAGKAGKQKKPLRRDMDVPHQLKRSGIRPPAYFLCDNSGFVLGVDGKGKPEQARMKFKEFQALHRKVLSGLHDVGAAAVLSFLEQWNPDHAAEWPVLKPLWEDLTAGGNIVFQLDGTTGFIHNRPAIRTAWERHSADKESGVLGQCLVTGEFGPIARVHDNIKGVAGTQRNGAPLVTANLPAFQSYGKKQSFNAPVSETAAFGYANALNFLLRSDRHRLEIGDTTTVFWAERAADLEEAMLAELMDPTGSPEGGPRSKRFGTTEPPTRYRRDPLATRLVHDILLQARVGRPLLEGVTEVDSNVRIYILALSPDSSSYRLSMRGLQMNTFGHLIAHIVQHYSDAAIDVPERDRNSFPSPGRIIKEAEASSRRKEGSERVADDKKSKAPPYAKLLLNAVTQGSDYPEDLYMAMLSRIGADQTVNAVRAGVIKACLLRKARIHGNFGKEEMITVSLNEQSPNTAYLLGRLFALLEKAQQDAAQGQLNATIRGRYFGAASATPQAVFPVLLRLAQHHIAKAEYGGLLDKRIEDVVTRINGFPAHLSLEQQGMFVLGYYHQRQALYQKRPADAGVTEGN